jgi:hypothetical protein
MNFPSPITFNFANSTHPSAPLKLIRNLYGDESEPGSLLYAEVG